MPKFNSGIFVNYRPFKKINTLWLELTGNPSSFPIESRIFHSISIGLILLAAVYAPYNLYAGLYVGSVSALIIGLLYSYQFYYSRFRGKKHNSTLFGVTGILIFGFNYFTNSGINGSTDLIWPAHLLLVLAISPYKQHLKWLTVYLLCFTLLHAVEYYYPFLVEHPFTAGKGQFTDRITAFPIPVFAVYLVIRFVRRSYDIERRVAEEKTIAVRTLMSIISHDLRTPLMNVQSYLGLLNELELDSMERQALEKNLLKSTDNAMEMLSNLLHWSKSQMEGPNVQLSEVNLLAVLNSTLEMEKTHAIKKKLSLSYNIPSQMRVIADVDMLQLVVRNLISNAIKFTPSGGIIHIKAELESNECKITVSDTGSGIPLGKQEMIFSINSAPAYGTNNERGVGLGLVLCKEFIELQGGRISFESNLGQGSNFFIFIPSVQ